MSFAAKLQEIRQNNELSQEKLAEILNVSRQSVSKWERGKGYPEIDKLIFISEHFDVSLDELLKGTKVKGTKNRRPIDLLKPNDREIREVYPNGSGNAYSYERTEQPAPSRTQPTQNIMQYDNYTCAPPSTGMNSSNTSALPKRRRRKINTKLSLKRMVVLTFFITSGGCLTTAAIYHRMHPVVRYNTVYITESETDAYEEVSYSEPYETRCLFDPDTLTYYIFDTVATNCRGIAEKIYSDRLDEYISLIDVETGENVYCYKQYSDNYPTFSRIEENGERYYYIIPHNMTVRSIDASEVENYTIMSNMETNEMCFIPNYILPEYRIETVNEETILYENDTDAVFQEEDTNDDTDEYEETDEDEVSEAVS